MDHVAASLLTAVRDNEDTFLLVKIKTLRKGNFFFLLMIRYFTVLRREVSPSRDEAGKMLNLHADAEPTCYRTLY